MNRKELDPTQSPGAAFGQLLRTSRDEHGWTQDDLADRMGYSGTHVSAVETGRRSPTPHFANSADKALGTGDQFARRARAARTTALLDGFPEYVAFEGIAEEIRLYEIGIIPGLIQTPEYARVLANSAVRRGTITTEQADARVAFLAARQAALTRAKPPVVIAVMDESCIRRPIGGAEVMARQLQQLIDFAELPTTVLQVAAFDIGERRPFDLPVNLLTLPDRSVVAYAESQTQGHLDRETTSVLPMLAAYHQLQAEALSQADSVAMIEEVRKGTP
ncbi:DNA-binding protein [Streptomyces sp. WM4235]|uniref:helix-turn-helix domain-containing protein n=1 Tax=Streptomyces sp. WM4235 TaxID=1415551 RepID=UPI0006AE621E|nr:helix-turn-helix transcriptional regulator [Streptomyces sp. WM4235]KOU38561.1 DNA-binding protein [Streptomyces sp. WM4235]